ncbi:cytochrome c oxidase assembly protein COX18, mitochondrial-like [Glandiceps talaboti]
MCLLHIYGVHRSAYRFCVQKLLCKRTLSSFSFNQNARCVPQKEQRRRSHVLNQFTYSVNYQNQFVGLHQKRYNSSSTAAKDVPGTKEVPITEDVPVDVPETGDVLERGVMPETGDVPIPEDELYVYIPTFDELGYEWIDYVHLQTSLPWWLTIIAATVAMRTAIHLPLAIMTQRTMARFENVQPEINGHVELFRQQTNIEAKERKWKPKFAAKKYDKGLREIVMAYHHRERCSPWRSLIPIGGHLITWYGMTIALGQMAGGSAQLFGTEMDVDFLPEFLNQGGLWFSNLTVPDPYFILPVMNFVTCIALIECWNLRRGPETKTFQRLKLLLRGVSLAMLPVATILPASIQLYWLTSSLCGLGYFFLLKQPTVRRMVGISRTPSEMTQPLKEMTYIFKARYLSKKIF